MKILYAIQGTGNGHLSRAKDIVPILEKKCKVDILVSGDQSQVKLPFKVKYKLKGLSFVFGEKGGIDFWNSYLNANSKLVLKEINSLPVEEYDFVINDFEPISAWACKKKNIPCVSLSHQAAVSNYRSPKPKKDNWFGRFLLKNYAPCNSSFGFHFAAYDKQIFTPIIRQEIRSKNPKKQDHFTVYLPAFSDKKIITVLSIFEEEKWQVFSKSAKEKYQVGNVKVYPINNKQFIKSFINCKGIITGAGFETPAEALFLGKKLMVIPMKDQYEQKCNAEALNQLGICTFKKLKRDNVALWLKDKKAIKIDYPDITEQIINKIFIAQIKEITKTEPTYSSARKV